MNNPDGWPDNAEYVPDDDADDDFCIDEKPYQVMPPLSEDEYESLKKSIEKHGIRDPIHVNADQDVLDGHHRILAAREVGLWGDKEREPGFVVHGVSEDDQACRKLAWELNMQQRHLDDGEKKAAVERRLKELDSRDEWKPNSDVADTLGVSESWVREVRRRLVGSGNIRSTADITTDTSGRRTKEDTDSKRELVKKALIDDPTKSNRSIARDLDVSHPFVGGVRDELGQPDVPPWWTEYQKNSSIWSHGVDGGVQILSIRDADDVWHISLRHRQFYQTRGLIGRGRNEGWTIARALAGSEIDAAKTVEEFSKHVDQYVREKDQELRDAGYDVEYDAATEVEE